ncbi:unnamed protein product [Notodromas monacha]|uniref:Cytosine-specific methyltransferase n=1 Tax=Notodromas monacha TaxID=399045 RepID=A0A7R9GBT6_9CRUS|nr:unnamed protein product [Notodromas monacha]CAG0915322.1 unnamed protein product [Notodromas monacha]
MGANQSRPANKSEESTSDDENVNPSKKNFPVCKKVSVRLGRCAADRIDKSASEAVIVTLSDDDEQEIKLEDEVRPEDEFQLKELCRKRKACVLVERLNNHKVESDDFKDEDFSKPKQRKKAERSSEPQPSLSHLASSRKKSYPSTSKGSLSKDTCKFCRQPKSMLVSFDPSKQDGFESFSKLLEEHPYLRDETGAVDDGLVFINILPNPVSSQEKDEDVEETHDLSLWLEDYVFYDEKMHMASFDENIDNGVTLRFSGKIRRYNDLGTDEKFIYDIGPVLTWWIVRDPGSETVSIGVSTDIGHYYLGTPHEAYAQYMTDAEEKSILLSYMINTMLENPEKSLDEVMDLLEQERPDFEEIYLRFKTFLVNHLVEYDVLDEPELQESIALRDLLSAMREKPGKVKKATKERIPKREASDKAHQPSHSTTNSKATTTPLVRSAFEHLFSNQMSGATSNKSAKSEEALDHLSISWPPNVVRLKRSTSWNSSAFKIISGRSYHDSCVLDDTETVEVGDFVRIKIEDNGEMNVAFLQIHAMYEEFKRMRFHGSRFLQGIETILGEALNPCEIFASRDCADLNLSDIESIVPVEMDKAPVKWRLDGGKDVPEYDGDSFVYKFMVDKAECSFKEVGFIDYKALHGKALVCQNCVWTESKGKPYISEEADSEILEVIYKDETYKVGDTVLIDPGNKLDPVVAERERIPTKAEIEAGKDKAIYTELYRKFEDGKMPKAKGFPEDVILPLNVGRISRMWKVGKDVQAEVDLFERVDEGDFKTEDKCLNNALTWAGTTSKVAVTKFAGHAKITRKELLGGTADSEWRSQHGFVLLDDAPEEIDELCAEFWKERVPKPAALKCMDLFSGVGGLSLGIHQSEVAETKWAVEFNPQAAKSFKLNNPDAFVYEGDINLILDVMMRSDVDPSVPRVWKGQPLPQKGEVDIITGGPPCQGYSGMNRFNYRENAKFRNSLVVSFLSMVEYLRPRFVVMENVKTFVTHNKGAILKLLLKSLVEAGYQCEVAVLQAGQFGVPQSRTRAIVLAAGPGEVLPKFPKPLTTFSARHSYPGFKIDGISYEPTNAWCDTNTAPYRFISVREAISDLPPVSVRDKKDTMDYLGPPQSAFQAEMRTGSSKVRDHISKPVCELVEYRIKHIPRYPGADWRDLPNREVVLNDGLHRKLEYRYKDFKGRMRGVCICNATGKKCGKENMVKYRQNKTVIPWCLPHNGKFHNDWAGLYGRILAGGFFSTTLTCPEPMGKQGCVLHYDQDRVVTVRECARSQGFPDHVTFAGKLEDRYRQIGNAVPPPLARAIGFQIRLAVVEKEKKRDDH